MSFVGASACACTAPLCGFGADRRRGPRKHLAPKPTRCVPIESTSAVAGGSTRRGAGATCARRESYGSVVRRTGVRPWPARVTHRWRGPRPPARSDGARGLESVNDESRSKSKTRPVGVRRTAPGLPSRVRAVIPSLYTVTPSHPGGEAQKTSWKALGASRSESATILDCARAGVCVSQCVCVCVCV